MTSPTSLPDYFLDLAHQLADFTTTHSRFPVQCDAPTASERALGNFLRSQRRALTLHERGDRDGTVLARAAYLDGLVPGWREQNTRPRERVQMTEFSARARGAARFVNRHGRLPASTAHDAKERSLGTFITNVRQARQGRGTILWDDAREDLLNRLVPGWEISPVPAFDQRIADIKAFVAQHRRAPRRHPGKLNELPADLRFESSLTLFGDRARTSSDERRKLAVEHALAA